MVGGLFSCADTQKYKGDEENGKESCFSRRREETIMWISWI